MTTCRANTRADIVPSQGLHSNSALESDFQKLKAELHELSAGLDMHEHYPSTAQAQLHTSSTLPAHAVFQGGPFGSCQQKWSSAVEHMSGNDNEPLQHDELNNGIAPAQRNVDDVYEQHGRHIQSDWTAQDASQQHNHQESSHTQRTGGEEGAKSVSRSHSTRPRSILGCLSVRSLPVLNNSFIVPAQAAKPKKVDRVTRYR